MDIDKQLIKEVENHKILYDPSHSSYKDVDMKNAVWKYIGRKLIGGEDEKTSVSALKVRWKSLRDAYVKVRRHEIAKNCGVKLKEKKPWRLKVQMDFLAPHVQNRKDPLFDDSSKMNGRKFSNPPDTENYEKTNASMLKYGLDKSQKNVFNETISNMNHERVIEIDSFFRGIADAVKGLNSRNQLLVQKDITNLVLDYKLQELENEDNQKFCNET